MSEVIDLNNGASQVEDSVTVGANTAMENQLLSGSNGEQSQTQSIDPVVQKRREGQIRADEKRKREQEEREARLVASAVETALAKVMPQFAQKPQEPERKAPELPDYFDGVDKASLEQYGELTGILQKGFQNAEARARMQYQSELESRFGHYDQGVAQKFAEIGGVLPQLQQGMVNSMAGVSSGIMADEAFQEYLDEEIADAGVSRRNAMAYWQKENPQKAAAMLSSYASGYQQRNKPVVGFDHMATPSQSAATIQSTQPTKRYSLAKINAARQAEMNKPNPDREVIQSLRNIETQARQTNTLDQ